MATPPASQDAQTDAWIAANNPLQDIQAPSDGDDTSEDDVDGGKPASHVHKRSHRPSHTSLPRWYELPECPAPKREPLVLPADPKKINGRQLTPPTRARDRELLNW